jgi:SAM-dependent methyltransferase
MNRFLYGVARAVAETFDLPGPVLEVGALHVPGQEEIADLRSLFPGKPYLGVDIRPGPGVDRVADVEALEQPDGSVGTVIAMNTLEHVPHFWKGLEEIYRVLRPDGALLLSCPFYFHVHSHPSDYWRFSPEALDVLLEKYPSRIIGRQGGPRRPIHVWAVGFRERRPAISDAQYLRYRSLVSRYAREPLAWPRRLRYGLGRWICGRRPFAPYLDQELWESTCRTSKAS